MTLGSLVFLTPFGALVAVGLALPLAGLALAARRERQARAALGLASPPPVGRAARILALAAVAALLGVAAAQPALRSTASAHVRTDAQAFFVVDVTRSMLASRAPGGPTRLARAKRAALALRGAIPEVPSGIATLTDRVVPDLFPISDPGVFRLTLDHAVTIENPPPTLDAVVATNVGAVGALGTQNFFAPSARRRLVVLLTDGESRGFDPGPVAKSLAAGPGVHLVVVHVWSGDESVFDGRQPEQGYHLHPESKDILDSLASAAGGRVFEEHSLSGAIRAVRDSVGTGPTIVRGRTERTRTLAPYAATLALLPLLVILRGAFRLGLVTAAASVVRDGVRRGAWLRRSRHDASRPARRPSETA